MRTMRLVVSVNFKRGILEGHVDIKLERNAKCFLLNKGLKVEYCSIEFSQKIVELTDFKEYEVNFIVLDKPIKNIEVKFTMTKSIAPIVSICLKNSRVIL